jgi:hypothetical protein
VSSRIGAERLGACALVLAALLSASRAAHADAPSPADAALAQSLFDEARHLMIANRFAEACPKLAESHRLDPAVGTLLNLAVCNERLGKTATAWAEYRDAESTAKREGRPDRVTYAREHATQLEPRLSHLFLVRGEGNRDPDLEVRLDGVVVGEPALGGPIPVDPGPHRIEARTAGKKPWSLEVTFGEQVEEKHAAIPALEDAPPPVPAPVVEAPPSSGATALPAPSVAPPAGETPTAKQPSRTAFYLVGTAGLASLAFGGVAGMQAIVRWNDRLKLCQGDVCSQGGLNADSAARGWALASDVALGVGAVGIGAAAYLLWSSRTADAPRSGRVVVSPMVTSTGGGVGVVAIW